MNPIRIAAASALAAASLFAADAAAQSILLPSTPEKGIALEAFHPSFRETAVTPSRPCCTSPGATPSRRTSV